MQIFYIRLTYTIRITKIKEWKEKTKSLFTFLWLEFKILYAKKSVKQYLKISTTLISNWHVGSKNLAVSQSLC